MSAFDALAAGGRFGALALRLWTPLLDAETMDLL